MLLFALLAAREIDRPFDGLHSWDAALAAWSARTHVHYGLGYTKGLTTLAVGDPPPAKPPRYLDHPQLHVLLDAASMELLGTNEVSLRLTALVVTALCLPFLIALLRRVYDDETALLAVFFYIVFPITVFFNASCWVHWVLPFALIAYWCYLVLIGGMRECPAPGRRHLAGLGLALFVLPQLTWFAVFYCAAIVSDYLLRILAKRRRANAQLLAVVVMGPLAGALTDLGVLLYGRGGDYRGLFGVYARRFHAFSGPERTPLKWLALQWKMVRWNFTLPVVLLAAGYLAWRLIVRLRSRHAGAPSEGASGERPRAFVHVWL
ncbi:MAG TPA: glycosyltransferase family 39 protein, partial [Elusimicrobiota bacterium]|nr:glycosyltransferase family 39 protein [Elusimicrobiota bacterium]